MFWQTSIGIKEAREKAMTTESKDITQIFQKEINKHKSTKEYFRDTIRRQLNQAPSWQIEILKEELDKLER